MTPKYAYIKSGIDEKTRKRYLRLRGGLHGTGKCVATELIRSLAHEDFEQSVLALLRAAKRAGYDRVGMEYQNGVCDLAEIDEQEGSEG